MPFDLDSLETWGHARSQAVQKTLIELRDNTLSDLDLAFGNLEECRKKLDEIRYRIASRHIEYAGRLSQEVLADVLEKVQILKQYVEERPANPRIWLIGNPGFVWGRGVSAEVTELVEIEQTPTAELAIIAVHGMNYDATFAEAFDSYFVPLEQAFRLFEHTDRPNGMTTSVVLISYDSNWFDEWERIYSVANVTSSLHHILAAAMWDECERRAKETSSFSLQFIKRIFENHKLVVSMTHSLGSFLYGDVVQQLVRDEFHRREDFHPGFWISLEAAFPDTAFLDNRIFQSTKKFFHSEFHQQSLGTIWLFHSYLDIILSTAYFYARREIASGLAGSREAAESWWGKDVITRYDTTEITTTKHNVSNTIPGSGGYFQALREYLERSDFSLNGYLKAT